MAWLQYDAVVACCPSIFANTRWLNRSGQQAACASTGSPLDRAWYSRNLSAFKAPRCLQIGGSWKASCMTGLRFLEVRWFFDFPKKSASLNKWWLIAWQYTPLRRAGSFKTCVFPCFHMFSLSLEASKWFHTTSGAQKNEPKDFVPWLRGATPGATALHGPGTGCWTTVSGARAGPLSFAAQRAREIHCRKERKQQLIKPYKAVENIQGVCSSLWRTVSSPAEASHGGLACTILGFRTALGSEIAMTEDAPESVKREDVFLLPPRWALQNLSRA